MFKMMSKTSRLLAISAVMCLAFAGAAQADLLLGWDFTAAGAPASTTGNVVSVNSTTNDTAIQTAPITRGPGAATAVNTFLDLNQGWGAMDGRRRFTSANLAAAKTAGAYFQWVVAPVSGNIMSLDSLDVVTYQSNVPNVNAGFIEIEYSLDNFVTAGTTVGTINPVSNMWIGQNTNFSLAGFANLQNTTSTVTFRSYGYGFPDYHNVGLGQITGNNTDVGVNGTVIPEPATLGLMAIGGLMMLSRKR